MSVDPRNPEISVGKTYHGFKVHRQERIAFHDMVITELIHDKTDGHLIHLSSEDDNNVFVVVLRTIPENSTGVAHILEHSVLEGSQSYPVRIFKNLAGRSLNTFLNAMTSADYTGYPFGSRNPKDYFNLMKLYLDAAFFPLLQKETFLQEAWRYEFANPGDASSKLTYKGVVYNEMKGAMSNPIRLFFEATKQAIFPDLTYSHVSGGFPKDIPDLTYKDWKTFHASHYHPSNAYLLSYGNFPLLSTLEIIDSRTFSHFHKIDPRPKIPVQKPYTKPMKIVKTFPIPEDEDTSKKSIVAVIWKLIPVEQYYLNLKLSFLCMILSGDTSSILNRELLASGLGNGPAPVEFDSSFSETLYGIGLKDVNESDAENIESIVLKTLQKVFDEGFPSDEIDAALHQLEFYANEIKGDGGVPYGMSLVFRGLKVWLGGGDFADPLSMSHYISKLNDECREESFFKDLIRDYLLENPHRVILILAPEPGGVERQEIALHKKLNQIRKSMSQNDVKNILKQSRMLKIHQEQEGDTSCLPEIKLNDIRKVPDRIPQKKFNIKDVPVFHHPLVTHGVQYVILTFSNLINESLPTSLFRLLTMLPELGAGDLDYVEMGRKLKETTGGVNVRVHPYRNAQEGQSLLSFSISGRSLPRNYTNMLHLMGDIILNPDTRDVQRIKELVGTRIAYAIPMAGYNGHRMSALAAGRSLSKIMRIQHQFEGFGYIKTLLDMEEQTVGELGATLDALLRGLISRENLKVSVTGLSDELKDFQTGLDALLSRLPSECPGKLSLLESPDHPDQQPEAWIINTDVSYVTQGFSVLPVEHPDAPHFHVLVELMEMPLYNRIRAKGGAYGAFASYNAEAGYFALMTYRDPHTARSLKAFQQVIKKIGSGDFSREQLSRAIIETIRKMDVPPSPREKGMIEFSRKLRGRTYTMREKYRKTILGTKRSDIERIIQRCFTDESQSRIALVTSDKILKNPETAHLNLVRIPVDRD